MAATFDVEIYVLYAGDEDRDMDEEVAYIKKNFPVENFNFSVKGEIEVPKRAYNPLRRQYKGNILLELLPQRAEVSGNVIPRTLGLTPVNLYVEGLNFIFGLSEINGQRCIVSTYMLVSPDTGLYLSRVLKEVVHEIGHTLGLRHCPETKCVMHFSNSLKDTDMKSHEFCKKCMNKIKLRMA